MRRNIGLADEHDDIMYPSTLPFVLIHLSCVAAFSTGHMAGGCDLHYVVWLRMFGIGAGYHRYFSHGPIRRAGYFNSSLRSSLKAAPKRVFCGGPRNAGTIICIRIRNRTCIRLVIRALYTVILGGFFLESTMLPIWSRWRTSLPFRN